MVILTKTKSVVCDSCGEHIENLKDAVVEWYFERKSNTQKGFRITHKEEIDNSQKVCQYDFSVLRNQGKELKDIEAYSAKSRLKELLSEENVLHIEVEFILNRL